MANQEHSNGHTCLVADDHPAVTHVIGELLRDHGYTVVASTDNGEEALAAIERHRPTVAVLDLSMPGLSGIDVAREALKASPDTAVILYTGHGQEALMHEALDSGVRGLVLKHAPLSEVVRAVELVSSGKIYVDPTLAIPLIAAGKKRVRGELTRRERDVLRLLADGMTNHEIGRELFISPQTVRTYIRKAMGKLQAANRTQAVATALRRSLIA